MARRCRGDAPEQGWPRAGTQGSGCLDYNAFIELRIATCEPLHTAPSLPSSPKQPPPGLHRTRAPGCSLLRSVGETTSHRRHASSRWGSGGLSVTLIPVRSMLRTHSSCAPGLLLLGLWLFHFRTFLSDVATLTPMHAFWHTRASIPVRCP